MIFCCHGNHFGGKNKAKLIFWLFISFIKGNISFKLAGMMQFKFIHNLHAQLKVCQHLVVTMATFLGVKTGQH